MASQTNGGVTVPGNLNVFGDGDVNGDVTINGTLTLDGSAGNLTASVVSLASHLLLTPVETAPTPPAEGMLYADTDHKLYFYNGTDWKEISFVA